MKSKFLIYTVVAFLLLGGYLWYFFNYQLQSETNNVEAPKIFKKVVVWSWELQLQPTPVSDFTFSTGELEQIQRLFETKSTEELQELANELEKSWDFEKAIKIFQKINDKWKFNQQLLHLYEKNYDYEKIKKLLDDYEHLSGKDLKLYLKAQLNLLDTDINKFSATLDDLKAQGKITTGDRTFFKGMTALYKGHFKDFKYFYERIPKDSPYFEFKQNIQSQLSRFESFRDVPEYYRDALIAYEVFKLGYIWLAKKMAFAVYGSKPSYILPNQILAYSYFLEWQWQKSQKYLKSLLRLDPDNKEFYSLLLGISYFYLQDYSSAINYLHMSKDFDLSYHFLIGALIKKGDIDEVLKLYYPLSLEWKLKDQEYWVLFENLFLANRALKELSPQQEVLLSKIVGSCYKDAKEKRICDLGEAGLMFSQDHLAQAAEHLEKFVDYYPSDNLFARLGNRWKNRDPQKAKQFYLKAVMAASDPSLKSYYKKQILDLILKKKDK